MNRFLRFTKYYTTEDLEMPVGLYDINAAALTQNYDFIVSTVVLISFRGWSDSAIIRNMQEHTIQVLQSHCIKLWIRKIIPLYRCSFVHLKEGELAEYYKDWEFKYNENPAISIVEMRMATSWFNFDLENHVAKKNIEKKQILASCF